MIDTWSRNISLRIKAADPENTSSVEVMEFAIGGYLNFAMTALLTASVGAITGMVWESLLCLVLFNVVRIFSGGFHLPHTVCVILSTTVFSVLPYVDASRTYVLLFTIAALILIAQFAPNIDPETSTLDAKFYPAWRIISVLLAASNLIFMSKLFALVLLVLAVLVIPFKGRR
ncbi:accessory gene regulator B family protein [Paenibacillus sp. P22]|uniref:accessory gene regulator B family protein n=1 Tax=Paenibacillus sp. P22 TaxID=483908 RepID=UPI000434D657|nr:accessory gene regulator B family protein [Paenibacillus sp. P22]CDN44173.1 Uncharacterized protein BN871_EI_00020 [Paenibacillus sp. P22]